MRLNLMMVQCVLLIGLYLSCCANGQAVKKVLPKLGQFLDWDGKGGDADTNFQEQFLVKDPTRQIQQATFVSGASTTGSGCTCLTPWYAVGDRLDGTCDNPTGDRSGVFCYVNASSCIQTPYSVRLELDQVGVFDYCNPSTGRTISGCECEHKWGFGGEQFLGTCSNPSDDPAGAWCFVNEESCNNPPKGQISGLKWDYCASSVIVQPTPEFVSSNDVTNAGCVCADSWSFGGGEIFNGTCGNPDSDIGGDWCYVDGRTCERRPFDINRNGAYDFCTPSPDTTINGCTCRRRWDIFTNTFGLGFSGVCANPDNDPLGSWCIVDPETCKDPAYGEIASQPGLAFDYCQDLDGPSVENMNDFVDEFEPEVLEVDVTLQGCKCRPGAMFDPFFNPFTFNGTCANPDNDASGSWCIVDAKTCSKEPEGKFDINPREGVADYYDYCEPPLAPPTEAGCQCEKKWQYPPGIQMQEQFYGVCGNPDDDVRGNWCVVNPATCTRGLPAGRLRPANSLLMFFAVDIDSPFFDYCPPGAPTMEDFNALLPADARIEAPSEQIPGVPDEQVVQFPPVQPILANLLQDTSTPEEEVVQSPDVLPLSNEQPIPSSPLTSVEPSPIVVEPTDAGEECKTVLERLTDTEQLSSMLQAVNSSSLTRILDDEEVQATVFAPTNEAFDAWLAKMGYASLNDFFTADPDALRNVVLYHIIANRRVESTDLPGEFITLFKESPIIAIVNPTLGVQILGGQGSSASVLLTDVVACNSVVHLIDNVLDVPLP